MTLANGTHEVAGRSAADAGRPRPGATGADGGACGVARPGRFSVALDWTRRLAPAVVLFSLFFAFEGGLRWLGLLGFVPLALTLSGGCGCGAGGRQGNAGPGAWPGAGA